MKKIHPKSKFIFYQDFRSSKRMRPKVDGTVMLHRWFFEIWSWYYTWIIFNTMRALSEKTAGEFFFLKNVLWLNSLSWLWIFSKKSSIFDRLKSSTPFSKKIQTYLRWFKNRFSFYIRYDVFRLIVKPFSTHTYGVKNFSRG